VQIQLTEEIARELSQILSVTVNLSTTDEYYSKLYRGDCSIYFIGWIPATGDGGEIFDYLLRSDNDPLGVGSYNFGYYSNHTVDEIASEITSTMNQKTRLNLMREGFKVAMEDITCVPHCDLESLPHKI